MCSACSVDSCNVCSTGSHNYELPLRRAEYFSDAPREFIYSLSEYLCLAIFGPNEAIIRSGFTGSKMYISSQQTRITIPLFCWVNLIILFSEGADIFDMFDELFSEMGGAGGFRRVSL